MSIKTCESTATTIRVARRDDHAAMLAIWERAVRATHHFLTEPEIVALRPAVAEVFSSDALDWWVIDTSHAVVAFLGVASNSVESLFIDPAFHGQGFGRQLIDHAQMLNARDALLVDVNEGNEFALAFYKHVGFEVIGRSETDGDGRPYPLLHMRRLAPRAT